MIEITEGNITTIAVWLYTIIGPSYLVTYGLDQGTFTTLFVIIVGIILNVWSSSKPNTISFLGNAPDEDEEIEDVSQ